MSSLPAAELLPPVVGGRQFTAARTVRLGDVDPSGRLRIDSIGRYLQDVATDDARDAELTNAMGWVVRRTMIRVERPGAMNESIELTTFCSGSGRSWAERRTSITGTRGASIEAVSLWVQVDAERGRPAALDDEFSRIYGSAAGGRRVSTKLTLPAPEAESECRPWTFRRTDLDPFGHVNNAVQWSALEDLLQADDQGRAGTAEIEYRAPIDLDDDLGLVTNAPMCWLVASGKASTAIRWTPAGQT